MVMRRQTRVTCHGLPMQEANQGIPQKKSSKIPRQQSQPAARQTAVASEMEVAMRVSSSELSGGIRKAVGEQVWWASVSSDKSMLIHAGAKLPRQVPLQRDDDLGGCDGFIRLEIACIWRARVRDAWVAAFDESDAADDVLRGVQGMVISEVVVHGELNDLVVRFTAGDESGATIEGFSDFSLDASSDPNWEICVGKVVWTAKSDGTLARTLREPP